MGSMPPYFSVYPLPARVPINAAILASQYMDWTVTVVDGAVPVDVVVERFASDSGPGATFAIRSAKGWPPDRALEVVARMNGTERRHPFKTSKSTHDVPPSCDWTGPYSIHPKSPTSGPEMWPTNVPRPPRNQRTFSRPEVESPAGYMVAAQLRVTDRDRTWSVEVGLTTTTTPSSPGPYVALTPAYADEFTDQAQLIGMTLTDLAGNVARYGTTS